MKRERRMNPKCQTRPGFDTFSAKSADLTGLKMRRITRAASFDQLIGAQQERFRDRQPEPFGGGQIDDEIELGRLFNRKLARLGAAQDLVDVVDLRRRLSNLHPPPGPGISVDRSVDRIAARANSTSFVHDFSYLAR